MYRFLKSSSKERASSSIAYRSGPSEDGSAGDHCAVLQAREGGAGVEVGAGQGGELHCHSQGGRPPAEIHWWDSDTGSRLVADMRGEYNTELFSIFISAANRLIG